MNPDLKYTILRKPRKRGATITVQPDNEVVISVPKYFSESMIQEILERQASWIAKKTAVYKNLRQKFPAKNYQEGDLFHFLGDVYSLKVQTAALRKVELQKNNLWVFCPQEIPSKGKDSLASVIRAWYESEAERILKVRVKYYEERMKLLGGEIEIKTIRSFWGSCAADKKLRFNARLIMAPLEVVDYVVVHELSHLVHRNHSYRFWNLVGQFIPQYARHRSWLNAHGAFLNF